MKKIKLKLVERSYDITIGSGVVRQLGDVIKTMKYAGPIVVITDKTVNSKAKAVIASMLKQMPEATSFIIVPGTEKSKSIATYQDTLVRISKRTKNHKPLIVALGGGVVGDLAGFVAATFRRGVPCIQIPTTLLAQVDSSVGGKVGIDLPAAKNLVGAFHQPEQVFVDTDFLRTLPARQIRNGLAEIIKYGIISNAAFFAYLEKNVFGILSLKKSILERVIHECLKIKARAVEKDEKDDKDIRITLNFGHTLGHAIETASGYSKAYNHGESIAVGMLLAGEIAMRLDMLAEKDFIRIKELIRKTGLPTRVSGVTLKDILSSHEYDKKFISGSNRFVLPRKIGAVEVVEDIPVLLIKTVLRRYVG